MKHALQVVALTAAVSTVFPGCITTAGFVKHQDVSPPLLIGAAAADLIVTAAASSQIQDYSVAASLATGLVFTALDLAVGCLTGACSSLKL
jgi:hypothetical protein